MKLHLYPINYLDGVHHILNELSIRGTGRMDANDHLRLLRLFLVGALGLHLLAVGIDGILALLVSINDGCREQFVELHDSLANYLLSQGNELLGINIEDAFRDFFHSNAYAIFFNDNNPSGQALNQEFLNSLNIFWFNVPYTLTMPGTVIDPGNGTLQPDGTVFYPFTGERLIPQDYVITATSRKMNLWAWIVSVLVILLALGSFVYRRKK